jgi:hypothetical protein
LQKAVLEAIDSLKPVDASQSTGRSARTYQILTLRYVQGLDLASEAGGRAVLDALIDGIGTRRIFLVLDNVEHVLAAAPLVAEVIAACPQLTVLATSRSPLKVHGEQEFAIAPLEVLNLWQPCSLAELASVASVALFRDRARAVGADFELTEENAAAISEICVRLDGIPLAIELAAARTKALAPSALLARLAATGKTELHLLNRGLRDLPARQQTMWAAIDWSYDLLAPVERLVFRRLSIFSGSFSLEAAEGIVSPTLASAKLLAEDEQLAPETILVDIVSTGTGTWRWPSGPNPSSAAPSRRAGSSGSSANTIICGQRSGGVSKTKWWPGCARRPASGASGGCVVTTTKVGAGWTSYWPRPFPR